MIETIPETFGVSIVFASQESEYNESEDRMYARVKDVFSADFVDMPAANRDGVFEAEIDNGGDDMPADKPAPTQPDAFDAKAAIEALQAQIAELTKPAPAPEPAPAPQPAAEVSLKAEIEELKGLVKAFAAAPPTKTSEAAPPSEPEQPAPAKSYADARKESIGNATGLQRIKAARAFDTKYADTEAYAASFKK